MNKDFMPNNRHKIFIHSRKLTNYRTVGLSIFDSSRRKAFFSLVISGHEKQKNERNVDIFFIEN